ncbi:MAG: hypothetical protein U5M50_09650 [Sphingobium sp.]|nr:hypothetical protein [Sphingobium sp.]
MSDFLAAYGLWLLIAILVVIVVMFLLVGGKRTSAEPISTQTAPEATTPAPATPETPVAVEEPIAAPVAVAGGAVPLMVTPEPVLDTPAPEPEAAPEPAQPAPAPAAPVAPAPTPAPAPAPAEASVPDDLLLLKGVGPKLKALLAEQGITRFAQIAAWTPADLAAIDPKLGTFKGRPERDNWIDQAQYLAKGDIAGFEAKYGKL